MNKDKELKFADFFIKWLNGSHIFDYKVFSNNNEGKIDTEIDVYAKSESKKFKQLNFQIVESEGILLEIQTGLKKKSKKTGENVVTGEVIDLDGEK